MIGRCHANVKITCFMARVRIERGNTSSRCTPLSLRGLKSQKYIIELSRVEQETPHLVSTLAGRLGHSKQWVVCLNGQDEGGSSVYV